MPGRLREEFWNLPNLITLGRIGCIPVAVVFTYWADPLHSFYAGAVFALAAISDILDGWIARRFDKITVLGKFMDPLADKLIVTSVLVTLVRLGRIGAAVVIILLCRELIVSGLRTVAMSEGLVIAASQEGKWKTSTQLSGVTALLVHYTYPIDFGLFVLQLDFNRIGAALLYISVLFSVMSAVGYFAAFLREVAKTESPRAATSRGAAGP